MPQIYVSLLTVLQVHYSAQSERLTVRVKEADDNNKFLNTVLDEMEEHIQVVEVSNSGFEDACRLFCLKA